MANTTSWNPWRLVFHRTLENDPVTRAANRRGRVAQTIFLGSVALAYWLDQTYPGSGFALIAVAGWALFGSIHFWSYWRYLASLDEMGRRIQLEALAVAYGFTLLAFSTLGAAGLFLGFSINPAWVLAAEPLRGVVLAFNARRYS